MGFVLAKIAFTPLLLAACTFVAHRWGDAVGGWLLGLPITSGPISIFLFAEHGVGFAEKAARATLFGVVAAAVFCAVYAIVSPRMRWWQSLGVSYAVCLATAGAFSLMSLTLAESLVVAFAALLVLAVAVRASARIHVPEGDGVGTTETGTAAHADERAPEEHEARTPHMRPNAGLAARMFVAAVTVLALTAIAGLMGPRIGGLLAPLPVLAAVMVASSDRRGAKDQAQGLLHGAVVGSWGGVAFFATVALMLPLAGALVTYGLATAVALAVSAIAMVVRERTGAMMPSWHAAHAG